MSGLKAGGLDVTLSCAPCAISPSIVAPAAAAGLVVDFLEMVLPDIRNHEPARAAARRIIECLPPRIAHAKVPDLRARTADEGIIRRNPESRWIGVATFTSIRSTFPRSSSGFCARASGSFDEPPSPMPMYKKPSGPKARCPPL